MKTTLRIFILALIASFSFYSCSSDDSDPADPTGIPDDSEATASPVISIEEINTLIPNAQFSAEGEYSVINVNLTGIQHPETKEWLRLLGTKQAEQNIWVEVDGKPKGILVQNLSAGDNNNQKVLADLVFLVDNSGSMSQEANAVAEGIVDWATKLSSQGLDIQFGCVGYESGINGALGFSNLSGINKYLNRAGRNGTSRTKGYQGADSLKLATAAKTYQNGYDECGAEALRFADENFSFRYGSNRIYVNFTDEPNQPGGSAEWSVEYVKDQTKWNTNKGTVHTVFSADSTNMYVSQYRYEKPWLMSDYTGGTSLFVRSDFKDVTLDQLPVTGAMANSYIIKFKNTSDLQDGTHTVKITILSPDQKVKSVKEFKNVKFGQ